MSNTKRLEEVKEKYKSDKFMLDELLYTLLRFDDKPTHFFTRLEILAHTRWEAEDIPELIKMVDLLRTSYDAGSANTIIQEEGTWTDADYNPLQEYQVLLWRSANIEHWNIDDLNPHKYDSNKMGILALWRGTKTEYWNVDDLNPEDYDYRQLYFVSLWRGTNPVFGNIDNLNPMNYGSEQMRDISLWRWDNKNYWNIDDLDPRKYSYNQMKTISLERWEGE